jgi:predicted transcriptional regulator of viral defense system
MGVPLAPAYVGRLAAEICRFVCESRQKVLVFANRMDKNKNHTGQSLATFVDELQAKGRYTFTRSEAAGADWFSDVALEAALRRLRQRGRVATPRRGFYVVVPLEYRKAECPPASWFIDDLMKFFNQPYYVGLLSAAAIHGAAHQQPMVFQVVTDRPTRPAQAGRVRISFHKSRSIDKLPVTEVQTETGSMRVSTPEATALDLVRFASAAGRLNNVATVLSELAEKLNPKALVKVARYFTVPDVQRMGYLLEILGAQDLAQPLADRLAARRYRPVLLAPERKTIAKIQANPRWRVIPNQEVEIDL